MEAPTIQFALPDGDGTFYYDEGYNAVRFSASLQDGNTIYGFNGKLVRESTNNVWGITRLNLELRFSNKWGDPVRSRRSISSGRHTWLLEQLEIAGAFEILDEHPQYLAAGARVLEIAEHRQLERSVEQAQRNQQWAANRLAEYRATYEQAIARHTQQVAEYDAQLQREETALADFLASNSIEPIELENLQF
jgi:hypothetical protein